MILEGVAFAAASTVRRRVQRSGPGGTDLGTQVDADRLDDSIRKEFGRVPKKKELASILADKSSRSFGTIMREIRSPKSRKYNYR